jgi:hypothetical protein
MERTEMTSPTPHAAKRPWWQGWSDFWFRGADPTTLAFIRICTGLLVLYVHLAYTVDLQAFFGKHGWYKLDAVNKEREEMPAYTAPWRDWDETLKLPRLSDYPHRRAEYMQFLKQTYLPSPDQTGNNPDPARDLAFLFRVNKLKPGEFTSAMEYVEVMNTREVRDRWLKVLVGGKVEQAAIGSEKKVDATQSYQPPEVFANMSVEERVKLAAEINAFLAALDRVKWRDPVRGRNYVFDHFRDIGPDARIIVIDYMESLTRESTAERERLLGFLEHWNTDPRVAYSIGFSTYSQWFHVTDPTQMAVLHSFIILIIVLFTIGLFTRVTSVLVWLAVIGYIHRTQQVLFGMDTMMNILLFYLMIGNCGAALSVDRLIARYRAARASIARTGGLDANTRAFLACPPRSVSAGFAQRLLQVHFCFIYAAAGLAKLKGEMWWDGRAFWEVLVNPEFTLMHFQWYQEVVRWIASVKPLYHFITATAVWFTLFVEIALPFLVWTKLRWLIVFFAVAMHAIIAVLMGLNLFELLMLVMLLAFLPDRVIRDRFRGRPDLTRYEYTFNPGIVSHAKAASLAVALDVDNQIAIAADGKKEEPAVVAAGEVYAGGSTGAVSLFRGLRLFNSMWLLLLIPGVKTLLRHKLFPTASHPSSELMVKPPSPARR